MTDLHACACPCGAARHWTITAAEQTLTLPAGPAPMVEVTDAAMFGPPPELQVSAAGWDPTHVVTVFPDAPADVVRDIAHHARRWAEQLDEHAHHTEMREASQ